MSASTTLEVILQARDEATAKLKSISAQAQDIGKTFGVAGAAITGALALAVNAAAGAQAAMARVNTTIERTVDAFSDAQYANIQKEANKAFGEGADVLDFLSSKIKQAGDAAVKMGFDDEDAAESMSILFQRTGDVTKAQQLQILSMDLARAKQISLGDATKLVSQVLSGNNKVLKQYGIELNDTNTPLQNLMELQKKVGGQADAFTKTFEGQSEVLKVTFGNLVETIGAQLLPMLSQLLNKITPIIDSITKWAEANPDLAQKIVLTTAAIGALLTVLGAVGFIMPAIVTAFTALTGPIGLTVLGITALVALFVFFRDKIGEVLEYIDQKTGLITLFKEQWDAVVATFNDFLLPQLQKLWEALQPLMPYLEQFGKFLVGVLVVAIGALAMSLSGLIQLVTLLLTAFTKFITWITTVATDALNTFGSVLDSIINRVNKVVSGVASVYGSVKGGVTSAVNSVVGFVTGKAGGGSVTADTPYVVGEKGPEMFTPSVSGTITPNRGLAGGGNITVNINGGTYLSEEVAGDIGDMIIQKFLQQSRI